MAQASSNSSNGPSGAELLAVLGPDEYDRQIKAQISKHKRLSIKDAQKKSLEDQIGVSSSVDSSM